MFSWKSLTILCSLRDRLPSKGSKRALFVQINDNNVVGFQAPALIMFIDSVLSHEEYYSTHF